MSPKVCYSALCHPVRTRTRQLILGISISTLLAVSATAQLEWDSLIHAPGAQGGYGNWVGEGDWWNGSGNVDWTNGSDAVFGGVVTGTVEAKQGQGVVVDDLNFPSLTNVDPYTLAGFFELGMGEGQHQITTTANATISASISGTQGFEKLGAGTLTLSGWNTYLGPVTVSEGTLTLSSENAIGPTSRLSIAAGSRVVNTLFEQTIASLTGAGSLTNNGVLNVGADDSSTTFSGTIEGTRGIIGAGDMVKIGAGTLTLSGAKTGFGGIDVEGGVLILSGTNTYSGPTNINQGTLEISGGNAIPDHRGVSVGPAGTFRLMTSETVSGLHGAGEVTLGANTLTIGGANFSGVISGTGSLVMEAASEQFGAFLTNPNSSFEGGLTIVQGTVILPFMANAGTNSPIGSNGAITFGDATHTGGLHLKNTEAVTTNRPIVVSAGGGSIHTTGAEVTLSGSLSGAGVLTKIGSGRLTLTGDKTFSGSFVVKDGTLRLGGNIVGVPVTLSLGIAYGGTLDSFGPAPKSMGALTVAGGGTVSPGLPGETDVFNTGNLTLSRGRLAINLNSLAASGYDSLNVTGAVSFDGLIDLTIELGYDPEDFVGAFPIIVNDGSDLTVFNGPNARFRHQGVLLEDGMQFLVTSNSFSQVFEIRYGLTAEDNDVRLIVIPEPSAAFLASLGALALGLRRNRRSGACS